MLKYKLKGKNIFINEDFFHENMKLRKELWGKKKKKKTEISVVKRRNNQDLRLTSHIILYYSWSADLLRSFP